MKKKLSFCLLLSLVGLLPLGYGIAKAATAYDPEQLANDELAKMQTGTENSIPSVSDGAWNNVVNGAIPLEINEEFIENWSNGVENMRLRPYHYNNAPDEPYGAEYAFIDDSNGKAVKITTNGSDGGAFDYVKFAGMRYIEDALYHVDITYTVTTPNRGWKVGFEHNYFLDLGGGNKNEVKVASGEFSATSDAGYNSNSGNSLIVMVAGGENSADIVINEIKIKRLIDKPTFKSISIDGKLAVNSQLTLNYDLQLIEGVELKNLNVKWFLTSSRDCLDKYILDEFNNLETITIPSSAEGKYIGCIVQPFSTAEGISGVGDKVTIVKSHVGEATPFPTYRFVEYNDTLLDHFDDISVTPHIGFEQNVGVTSYITSENAISGKSLYINNSTNETMGGYFTNMKFKGDRAYTVSFKIKFLNKPTGLFFQFRAIDSLGYSGDVKSQLSISSMKNNQVYNIYIPSLKLANVSDYRCQIFSTSACEYLIDDFSIKMVQSSDEINNLKTVGGEMLEDFDTKNILTKIDTFEWDGITIGEGFDGNGLIFQSKDSGGSTCYFYDFIEKLEAGYKYEVSFDYQLKTAQTPQEMYFGVRNMVGNQDNIRMTFEGKSINTTYSWSHTFTLPNEKDMYFQLFNMQGDSSLIIFDNLRIVCRG